MIEVFYGLVRTACTATVRSSYKEQGQGKDGQGTKEMFHDHSFE